MTETSDFEARAAEIEAAMTPYRVAARRLIERRTGDAAGHALRGVSEALRGTRDGRATIARVRRSRSYGAALARLAELSDGLVKVVTRYRDAAYLSAHAFAVSTLPAEILRTPDPSPRDADRKAARGMALHGMLPTTEIKSAIVAAGRTLESILGRVSRSLSHADTVDLLDDWEEKTKSNLEKVIDRLLSDSAVALESRAVIDAARPGLFHFNPIIGK